jgi:hypothetical protein
MIDGAASAAAAALALLMRLLRVIFMGYLLRVVGCSRVFPVSISAVKYSLSELVEYAIGYSACSGSAESINSQRWRTVNALDDPDMMLDHGHRPKLT